MHRYNCRHKLLRKMGTMDGPRVGRTGTNKLRTPVETATGLPFRWFGGISKHAVDNTAAHVDNHNSEALRTCSADSRVCSRAMMWSRLAAVPASSTGSRCDGPRSASMGAARQDAGREQRIRTHARASHGCSRPWTAQQLLAMRLRTFRTPEQLTELNQHFRVAEASGADSEDDVVWWNDHLDLHRRWG